MMPTPSHLPETLEHNLRGWPPPGPNGFRWSNGLLHFRLPDWSAPVRDWDKAVSPIPAAWDELWSACDRLKIWDLPPRFGDADVLDGLQVSTRIVHGPRSLSIDGQCAGAPREVCDTILLLHSALQQLALPSSR